MTTTIRERAKAFASLFRTTLLSKAALILCNGLKRATAFTRERFEAWHRERLRYSALPAIRRAGDLLTIAPPRQGTLAASPVGPTTVIVRCATVTRFSLLKPDGDGAAWSVLASVSGEHSNEATLLAEGLRLSEAQWVLRRIGSLMDGSSTVVGGGEGGGSWFWRAAAVGVIGLAVMWAWSFNKRDDVNSATAMMDPAFVPPAPEFSELPLPGALSPQASAQPSPTATTTDAFGLSGGDGDHGLVPAAAGQGAAPAPLAGCDPGMAFEVN